MTLDLAPRERRTLLVGGAVLALLLSFRAVPAWLRWRADALAGSAEVTRELERTRGAIRGVHSALDTTEARVARLRAAAPSLLVVQSASDAPGALADQVREAARLSGVEIEAVQTRVDSAGGQRLQHVVATLQGRTDVAGLAALLDRLEEGEPLLSVDGLSVQAQDVAAPREGAEVLRVKVRVAALSIVTAAAAAR